MIEITTKYLDSVRLAGMHIDTSPAVRQGKLIWKEFMPRQGELLGLDKDVYYSVHDYPVDYPWETYNPEARFTTWAAKEVEDDSSLPDGFSTTQIKGGLYAFFIHTGTANNIGRSMIYFHGQWLPNSGFSLDKKRKHFEKLDKQYLGSENPLSKEEVYIPILANQYIYEK